MLPINPYIAGDPVGNSPAFIGRDDVLREVLKILNNPHLSAITLYGQRRIGKTSMLQYLQSNLPKDENFQAVYFDLQDKAVWPLQRLLFELARTIADRLELPEPTFRVDAFRGWLATTLKQLSANTNIVLLFDEFDVLADPQSGQAATDFFPYLRTLISLDRARLKFVFILGRNITDLSSIALSIFKGIPSKRVSLLNKAETFKVARLSEQNNSLQWSEKALETVWGLTHGHPYLTQALCSQVWDAIYDEAPKETPQATPEMVESAAPAALDSSRNMLEWLWNGLGPAEKVVSAALAGAGSVLVEETRLEQILRESGVRILIRELQDAPELLRDWDILEAVDGGYIFQVELLRRWIVKYHPLGRTRDELDRIQPAADSLSRASESFYQQGDLTRAEDYLRQAIGINPNHVRANQLLSEILLSSNRLDEAREKLEKLAEVAPNAARPRLVQVYLLQAEAEPDEERRLSLYEKTLSLDANQPDAILGIEKFKVEQERIRQVELAEQERVRQLELVEMERVRQADLIEQERIKQLELARQNEEEIAYTFLEGRHALQRNEREKAIELFQKVVAKQPGYTYETTRGAETAADLLAQSIHKNQAHPHQVLIRKLQMPCFLRGALLIVTMLFCFSMGWLIASIRNPDSGTLSRSTLTKFVTYTIKATKISTPTLIPTIQDTPKPTATIKPTMLPTSIIVSSWKRPSDKMEMLYIPGNTFVMGSNNYDIDEKPTHSVTLPSYWMDKTEITNAMYRICVNDRGCTEPKNREDFLNANLQNFPVVYINWNQSVDYCSWAGKDKTGKPFQDPNGQDVDITLPTEAQWEYAARGPYGYTYPWGNDWDCKKANSSGKWCDGFQGLAPIGSFKDGASFFEILDMSGNAWEWTDDWYDKNYYQNSPTNNPNGPTIGDRRVLRGGSWFYTSAFLRATKRAAYLPYNSSYYIGFRCVGILKR
jgi:formylglycine-generating enzyme required for sulfatase activity